MATNKMSTVEEEIDLLALAKYLFHYVVWIVAIGAAVGVVPDAVIAGHEADGVIYVVKSGEVNSKELAEQLDMLQQAGIECCGFVLNAVDQKNKSHYGKYNSYYNR